MTFTRACTTPICIHYAAVPAVVRTLECPDDWTWPFVPVLPFTLDIKGALDLTKRSPPSLLRAQLPLQRWESRSRCSQLLSACVLV